MDQTTLLDKTVLITGASHRIGRALALACADAGANVVIHFRHSSELAEETHRLVRQRGRRAWTFQADFSRPHEVQRLAKSAFSLGPIHALVNNAAIFGSEGLSETTLREWDRHMSINLTAPFILSQAFARQPTSVPGGRIVNILDWRALHTGPDHFAYTVSKAALASMTRSLAQAVAPGISVNGLALGAILPPEGSEPDAQIIQRVPARRWGTPDEVGQALLFLLAGPAYITGEIVYVDGGRHLT